MFGFVKDFLHPKTAIMGNTTSFHPNMIGFITSLNVVNHEGLRKPSTNSGIIDHNGLRKPSLNLVTTKFITSSAII